MNEFKKCKVVMLDAKNSTGLAFSFKTNELFIPVFDSLNYKECIYKHLYILSDDEIKEGDYAFEIERRRLGRILKSEINKEGIWDLKIETEEYEYYPVNIPKKVIASTDISLGVLYLDENFIKQYVEANGFDEILIKYKNEQPTFSVDFYNCKLPIIKMIKSSFNKEELPIQAIKDCLKYCENQQVYDKLSQYGDFYYKLNQFIKENDL